MWKLLKMGVSRCLYIITLAFVVVLIGAGSVCIAEVTPEQTQELREIKKDLGKLSSLLRKKQLEEAESVLADAEQRLKAIIQAAEVPETSRRLLGLPAHIAGRRKALDTLRGRMMAKPAPKGVSFSNDVAPVIVKHCLECHGDANPRAGLNLTNFTGWKKGGVGGVLLTPGAPLQSRIIARLQTNDPMFRMPRGKDALSAEVVKTIGTWINEGAKFDGASEETPLSELAKPRPEVEIPRPKGTETVSFTKDIAPFIVGLCLNCHSGNNPRGGLSLTTFENIMVGGDSGAVILPGKREESRLFRLTGGLENPRMPASDGRLTRENYENLVKWFDEGNVFDGDDPRALLTSYVPSAENLEAEQFTKMAAEEIAAHRQERTEELWKQSLPNVEHRTIETDQFLILGDVPEERLREVGEWASEQLKSVQKTFGDSPFAEGEVVWRGKLAILVFKERFGLTEYFLSTRSLRQSDTLFGDTVVTPSASDACIVLLDTGDEATNTTPSLRTNLQAHLIEAYLRRAAEPNQVLTQGIGLHLTALEEPTDPYLRALPEAAVSRLRQVKTTTELFADGTFAPADIGPVGYSIVKFFSEQTNRETMLKFIQAVRDGQDFGDAMKSAAGSDLDTFGTAFLNSVQSGR